MTTVDFISDLFCRIDEAMKSLPKHPQAALWPSEVVTLGVLHALKGVGNRAFYRWLERDYRPLFPRVPERTRLFRLFRTHRAWTASFLAVPTLLGVIDTYGIELIHPIREGRSPTRSAAKSSRSIAGSAAARWACWSSGSAWWWRGSVAQPMSMTRLFSPLSGRWQTRCSC